MKVLSAEVKSNSLAGCGKTHLDSDSEPERLKPPQTGMFLNQACNHLSRDYSSRDSLRAKKRYVEPHSAKRTASA